MAALTQEVARSTPELKSAFQQGLEKILSASGEDQKEAIFRTAAMMGGVVLAHAVQDPRFSDAADGFLANSDRSSPEAGFWEITREAGQCLRMLSFHVAV